MPAISTNNLPERRRKILRVLMARDNITIKTLSLKTGIPLNTLYKMQRGESKWTLDNLATLSNYFKVDNNTAAVLLRGGERCQWE